MTFVRQVVSLVANPQLLEKHSDLFPSDAVARAKVRREGERKGGEVCLVLVAVRGFLTFDASCRKSSEYA